MLKVVVVVAVLFAYTSVSRIYSHMLEHLALYMEKEQNNIVLGGPGVIAECDETGLRKKWRTLAQACCAGQPNKILLYRRWLGAFARGNRNCVLTHGVGRRIFARMKKHVPKTITSRNPSRLCLQVRKWQFRFQCGGVDVIDAIGSVSEYV